MTSFNPDNHNNTINPYQLSDEKQAEIMKAVDDDRLSNPPGDYFKLTLGDKVVDIPKSDTISVRTDTGGIKSIDTAVYIQNQLDEFGTNI